MKAASIYSTKGAMAYQYGNSRVLVQGERRTFQVMRNGAWQTGRQSYRDSTLAKVIAAVRAA